MSEDGTLRCVLIIKQKRKSTGRKKIIEHLCISYYVDFSISFHFVQHSINKMLQEIGYILEDGVVYSLVMISYCQNNM